MQKTYVRKSLVWVVVFIFMILCVFSCISKSTNPIKKAVFKNVTNVEFEDIHGFSYDEGGYIINNHLIREENQANYYNGPGEIDPIWITNQDTREYYKSIYAYDDFIYATGFFYDIESETYYTIISKYDSSNGNIIWMKNWSSHHPDAMARSIVVYDDAIYIVGDTGDMGFIISWMDAFICKYDLDGNLIWSKVINENIFDEFSCVKVLEEFIYICGSKTATNSWNAWILKFDFNGNKIWDKSYIVPGTNECHLYDFEIYDGFIYAEGQTDSWDDTRQDVFIVKISLEGELIWYKEWGGTGPQLGTRLDVYEGFIYVCGYGKDEYTIWGGTDLLLKYDPQGDLLWDTSSLCSPANAIDVIGYDGAIYTVGEIWRGYGNGYDAVLFKFDEDSNLIWYLTWGPYGYAGGDSIAENEDFFYIVGSIDGQGFLLKNDIDVFMGNIKPNKPSRPSGETMGKVNQLYTYSSASSDPDGGLLSYGFLWDDGNLTFIEWFDSDETISASYSWDMKGSYNIRVRARDECGYVSEWSDPLEVSMPRDRIMTITFLMRLIERVPLVKEVLTRLIIR